MRSFEFFCDFPINAIVDLLHNFVHFVRVRVLFLETASEERFVQRNNVSTMHFVLTLSLQLVQPPVVRNDHTTVGTERLLRPRGCKFFSSLGDLLVDVLNQCCCIHVESCDG